VVNRGPRRTATTIDEACRVVAQYINATTDEERLRFVRDPARIRPLMASGRLQSNDAVILPGAKILVSADPSRPVIVAVPTRVRRLYAQVSESETRLSYVVKTADGFKVDWEATAAHEPLPLSSFSQEKPSRPMLFRVTCRPSETYEGPYANSRETHLSFELTGPLGHEFHGYIPRDSEDGKRLAAAVMEIITQTRPVALVLQHAGPDGKPLLERSHDGLNVAITRMASDSWVVFEGDGVSRPKS
jgi:hypothetical protein